MKDPVLASKDFYFKLIFQTSRDIREKHLIIVVNQKVDSKNYNKVIFAVNQKVDSNNYYGLCCHSAKIAEN